MSLLICGIIASCGAAPTGAPTEPSESDLSIEPDFVTILVGETSQLKLRTSGRPPPIVWTSQDPSVATVTSSGLVEAVDVGTVLIDASFDRPGEGEGLTKRQATVRVISDDLSKDGPLRAFPEAEGWGAEALNVCDRSRVQLLTVTSMGNDGPGTLRDAIETADPSILTVIRFAVGGYIDLRHPIMVRTACLYIAGQTAPGDGVTVRSTDVKALFLKGQTRDVVIRYLRFRGGTERPGENTTSQGVIIGAGVNVMLDHLSFSWMTDELMSIYRYPESGGRGDVRSITVQNTLLAEPLASSPVCFSTKGETRLENDTNGIPQWYEVENVSFHRNVAMHCSHRAPKIASRDAVITNSVVYNWDIGAIHVSGRKPYVDVINNYFKSGPMNRGLDVPFGREYSHEFRNNRPGGGRGGEPDEYILIGSGHVTWDGREGPGVYLAGNVGPSNPAGSLDNWAMTSKYKNDETNGYPESIYQDVEYADLGLMPTMIDGVPMRRSTPLPGSPFPVSIVDAQSAWHSLVVEGDVGANRTLDCQGNWVDNRDEVDQRLLREAREGGGVSKPPASEQEVGGFPDLAPGKACADSDGDGMPDEFEGRYGLSATDASDAAFDSDGDGYVNLEEYLNGTRPQ